MDRYFLKRFMSGKLERDKLVPDTNIQRQLQARGVIDWCLAPIFSIQWQLEYWLQKLVFLLFACNRFALYV